MRHDQALPVDCQYVRPAAVLEHKPAARHAGLQEQMHFRVVAERLKMADALRRPGDRLLVDDRGVAEGHVKAQPLPDHALQDLFLYLSHDLGRDLFFLLVVEEMQGRVFLFQNTEIPVRLEKILSRRKDHGTAEHRLQQLLLAS